MTSASQFNAEAAINGTRIIVNTSFSGGLTITGNDIDIVMSNSATITGNLQLGSFSNRSTRVRWTGGNISGRLLGNNFQDYLFDDFYLHAGSNFNDLTAANRRFDRVAFLNTTLRNGPVGGGNDWVIFVLQRPPSDRHQGLIFANTKIMTDGGLHPWRLMSVRDILIVDSVGNPDGGGTSGLRFHDSCENVWVRDSWVRGNFHMNELTSGQAQVINGLFDGFDRYSPDGLYAYAAPASIASSGQIRNSTLYRASGNGSASVSGFSNGGGNSEVSWNGSSVPDYSEVGAIR